MDGFAPHFSYSDELRCPCGCVTPPDVLERLRTLSWHLEALRDAVGGPITVTSGYRCAAHNREIKGARKSKHMKGIAADIMASGFSGADLKGIVEHKILMSEIPEGGIGLYRAYPDLLHYDSRGKRARWLQ